MILDWNSWGFTGAGLAVGLVWLPDLAGGGAGSGGSVSGDTGTGHRLPILGAGF